MVAGMKSRHPWWAAALCRVLGHRYRFLCISLEGDRVFVCRRCGDTWCR